MVAGFAVRDLPPVPPAQRASLPPELRGLRRDHVRLLVADRTKGRLTHSRFDAIGDHLRAGDLLVLNTSRTLPAALPARRQDGSTVQIRPCVRRPGRGPGGSRASAGSAWDVLAVEPVAPFANVELRPGERLVMGGGSLHATVVGRRPDIPLLWRLTTDGDGLSAMAATGEPIRYSYVPRPVPLDFYQNVYAGVPGSAEMASAGRPFSWELLLALRRRGVRTAELVLHTGLSSYQDDAFDLEHHLYEEWFEVSQATAEAVNGAERVIAVGTTVVRALESSLGPGGHVRATSGWTDLRIGPGTPILSVDGLITGMHEPMASHFDLLEAFLDRDLLARAYSEALDRGYLWHEFGDSMLIV
ncbi:MAG TPA: S-adenosylmethionine:tRNA ribosyltransferase-isomerase [Candidatus Dormibacteraeota bacterium]|jgi:S-adenosylmethionine:tRNA ribosyltransferase-isomerase|nr:S-adenosylmethionine:tRNA ribosyltransferase-isomerase [Candidatus Dormibacteraeota bacterium]